MLKLVTFTLSWILWSIQLSFTSNLLGGCSNTAVGLSSSVMPSLVSLCVASSWLKLRPIILRSSKSAALLSLVSLHTLFSRLRDFSMDFLGMGSPFFTSTNNLIKKNKQKQSKSPVSPVKAAKHEVYGKKYWATKMLHPQKLLKSSWDTLFLLMLMQKQVYNSIVTESALPTMNMLSMPAFSYWDNSDRVGVAPQCFYFAVMPLAADQEEREEISPNLLQHSTVSALEWPISSLVCIAWFYTRVVMGLKIQCGQFFFHTSNQNLFMAKFQF